jgi:large subunit ribosomal protein L37Ae
MEITQHAKYTCTFCGKVTVRRQAVGIWDCKSCKRTVAGGAYTVSCVKPPSQSSSLETPSSWTTKMNKRGNTNCLCSTPAAAAMRSTLRRLREIAEV